MAYNYNKFVFFLLSLSFLNAALARSRRNPALSCNASDLKALHGFKAAITLDTSKRLEKWVGKSCCQWEGIKCDGKTGRVTEISLPGLITEGEIFGQTEMRGVLSSSVTLLSSLEVLDLGGLLHLSGSIPDSIGLHFPKLRKIILFNNNMSGPIPESISKLSNLEELTLHANQFSGSIPIGIGSLKKLQRLYLDSNRLSGPIPDSITSLMNLITLDLQDNFLSGTIPQKIGALRSLKELDLSNNRLSGKLPVSITNLTVIESAYFNNNLLEGEIPFPVNPGDMPSLGFLRLHDNQLTGNIPSSFGYLSSLQRLTLSNNKLEGSIPSSFGNLMKLQELYLEGNRLSGTIPGSFGKLSRLMVFDLSYNMIQGPLSQELSSLENLQILDLSFNSLNLQSIPKWLATLPSISQIRLAGCGIQGEIPEVLRENRGPLQTLDLSVNNLTGIIPTWIGELTELYSLNLSRNSLISNIPDTITKIQDLGVLDLHSNNLTGSVGKVFQMESRFPDGSLTHVDLSDNRFSGGHEDVGTGSQIVIQQLNLSKNLLKGGLPTSLGKLERLEALDFSSNQLQSRLQDSLANATSLLILKLQKNQLSGTIPSDFLKLKKLKELDISDNHLEGQIPNGKPFTDFPQSSYSGNKGLCGKPLPPCKR